MRERAGALSRLLPRAHVESPAIIAEPFLRNSYKVCPNKYCEALLKIPLQSEALRGRGGAT